MSKTIVAVIHSLLFIALTTIQGCWAMYEYRSPLSIVYGSLWADYFFSSLFYLPVYGAVLWCLHKLKINITGIVVVATVLLFLFWMYLNYSTFVIRESAWSTYTFNEELIYTVHKSILPVSVSCLLFAFIIRAMLQKWKGKLVSKKHGGSPEK